MREPTDDLDAALHELSEERTALVDARAGRVRAATAAEADAVEAVSRETAWLRARLRPARNAALVLDRDARGWSTVVPLSVGSFALAFACGAGVTPAVIALGGTFVSWLCSRLLGRIWLG